MIYGQIVVLYPDMYFVIHHTDMSYWSTDRSR